MSRKGRATTRANSRGRGGRAPTHRAAILAYLAILVVRDGLDMLYTSVLVLASMCVYIYKYKYVYIYIMIATLEYDRVLLLLEILV